jgi:cyclic pyranopterin phosphate synthase
MPREVFGPDFAFLPQHALLSFEEITRLVRVFASLGVEKIRLTGGEPLLRRDLDQLIAMIAETPGIEDIALTTNGSLLTRQRAADLKAAGLKRISISLDSLDDAVFMKMNDVHFPVAKVLAAIEAAAEAGLSPVKVNTVVKKGVNDDGVLDLAERFRHTGVIVRFIEFMDVGNSNGWRLDDVVPSETILSQISAKWPLVPVAPVRPGEVAKRYRYVDGGGEIGLISSVSQPFCGGCTRARLSSEGQLYTCLFGTAGFDLRALLRSDQTDEALAAAIRGVWEHRRDRYSELRSAATPRRPKVEMSHIGG